jgi:alcohol dehydrogenase class IV
MEAFSLEMPREIHFGSGSRARLSGLAAAARRVLLVMGRHVSANTVLLGELEKALDGRTVDRLVCAAGEPDTAGVDAAAARGAAFGPDLIIAIGGGSVLDTGKALSALAHAGPPVERFLEGMPGVLPVSGPCVPWIAMPTTAGTGSEVTKNAVVRIDEAGVKRSMRSGSLLARAVIVDPALTLGVPLRETGTSGLDALTQLVESYLSKGSTPPVRSLVEGAFPGMLEALEGLPRGLDDPRLRGQAAYGALVSGIALANAGLGAAHGFAAALGGSHGVPHGLACAVMLPHVLEANTPVIAEGMERLMGRDGARRLADRVRALLAAFDLPSTLSGYGIRAEDLPRLAEMSSGSSMRGNPREIGLAERAEILARVI